MPELALQEKAAQEATAIYGIKFTLDDSSVDLSNISTWPLDPRAQPATMYKVGISPTVNQQDRETSVKDWLENEDSFTRADLLDIEDNQVQQLIFQIRRSTSIPNNAHLANRLTTLFHDEKEEDSDSSGITVESLRNFYFFLLLTLRANLKYPAISLTPDNDIYISWRNGQNQVFSVHFLTNGDVRFVIFKPNDRHPERTTRLSGTTTTDTLIETVDSYGVWDWISE